MTFLSLSSCAARSCSTLSSSASLAASIMARAAFSSESLASLAISSRSAFILLTSFSSFLFAAERAWWCWSHQQAAHWCQKGLAQKLFWIYQPAQEGFLPPQGHSWLHLPFSQQQPGILEQQISGMILPQALSGHL